MALERSNCCFGLAVVFASRVHSVAVKDEFALQRQNPLAAIARLEHRPVRGARRRRICADTGRSQPPPREKFSRILLSQRRDVGMRDDIARSDAVTQNDVARQRDYSAYLFLREMRT